MSTKLIKTKDYLLLIDEEAEIKPKNKVWWEDPEDGLTSQLNTVVEVNEELIFMSEPYASEIEALPQEVSLVIAYYPLTKEAKELDLPLLPVTPKNEWGVHEKHCCSKHGCKYGNNDCCVKLGIAKQRYPCEDCNDEEQEFSLEDVKKAIEMARDYNDGWLYTEEEIIQSISTQQLPKEFIPEYEKRCWWVDGGRFECSNLLKTITNSEGKKEIQGIYKY